MARADADTDADTDTDRSEAEETRERRRRRGRRAVEGRRRKCECEGVVTRAKDAESHRASHRRPPTGLIANLQIRQPTLSSLLLSLSSAVPCASGVCRAPSMPGACALGFPHSLLAEPCAGCVKAAARPPIRRQTEIMPGGYLGSALLLPTLLRFVRQKRTRATKICSHHAGKPPDSGSVRWPCPSCRSPLSMCFPPPPNLLLQLPPF